MPVTAIRGTSSPLELQTSQAVDSLKCPGILIKVDPHIKALLVAIDEVNHDYIIEDLDEEHLLVREAMLVALKAELENVRPHSITRRSAGPTARTCVEVT